MPFGFPSVEFGFRQLADSNCTLTYPNPQQTDPNATATTSEPCANLDISMCGKLEKCKDEYNKCCGSSGSASTTSLASVAVLLAVLSITAE